MRLASCFMFLLLCCTNTYARVVSGDQSKTIQFDHLGWNKTLILKNGNTVLMHFEVKKMNVKIYDAKHEEIVHKEYTTKDFSHHWLRSFTFKALFEENGELVLFSENVFHNKESLLRISFDAATGNIKEEAVTLADGDGQEKNTYFVLKDHHSDNYSVFSSRMLVRRPSAVDQLYRFSGTHQLLATIPANITYHDARFMKPLTVGISGNDDIYFALAFSYTGGKWPALVNNLHEAAFGILSKNAHEFKMKTVELPDVVHKIAPEKNPQTGNIENPPYHETLPYAAGYVYDTNAQQLNIIIIDPVIVIGADVYSTYTRRECKYVLYTIDSRDMSVTTKDIDYKNADEQVRNKSGNGRSYQAIPAVLFSKDGKLSLISENYTEASLTDLCFTRFNKDRRQISDTAMPWTKFTGIFTHPEDIYNTNNESADIPMQQYDAIRCYYSDSLIFVFYNENEEIKKADANPNKMPDYKLSNSECFVLDEHGNCEKILPFGTSTRTETKALLMESACYDADKHTFVCLMQDRRSDNISYHVAWCYLTNFIAK